MEKMKECHPKGKKVYLKGKERKMKRRERAYSPLVTRRKREKKKIKA